MEDCRYKDAKCALYHHDKALTDEYKKKVCCNYGKDIFWGESYCTVFSTLSNLEKIVGKEKFNKNFEIDSKSEIIIPTKEELLVGLSKQREYVKKLNGIYFYPTRDWGKLYRRIIKFFMNKDEQNQKADL